MSTNENRFITWRLMDDDTRGKLLELGWTPREWNATEYKTRQGILDRMEQHEVDDVVAAGDAADWNFRR